MKLSLLLGLFWYCGNLLVFTYLHFSWYICTFYTYLFIFIRPSFTTLVFSPPGRKSNSSCTNAGNLRMTPDTVMICKLGVSFCRRVFEQSIAHLLSHVIVWCTCGVTLDCTSQLLVTTQYIYCLYKGIHFHTHLHQSRYSLIKHWDHYIW